MVNYLGLDNVFAALADPTRRAIVARLAEGPASVNELAAPFDMSLPAVSKHLKVLERAGLMKRRKRGRVHECRLESAPLDKGLNWIADQRQMWNERLDALGNYLNETDK